MTEPTPIVIDANIIAEVYRESSGQSLSCTAPPSSVIDDLQTSGREILLDIDGHILHEWQSCVNYEWFENWYLTFATQSNVASIAVDPCQVLLKELQSKHGFPKSADKWLVRTAATGARIAQSCDLLSEDMDFREPKAKGGKDRQAHLSGQKKGGVYKALEQQGVVVISIMQY